MHRKQILLGSSLFFRPRMEDEVFTTCHKAPFLALLEIHLVELVELAVSQYQAYEQQEEYDHTRVKDNIHAYFLPISAHSLK
jgi:hypothetical protein